MGLIEDCAKAIQKVYIPAMRYGTKSARLDWKNGVELTDEEVSWIEWFREQGFNYLVRDLNGYLFAFAAKPVYEKGEWRSESNWCVVREKELFGLTIGPGGMEAPVYVGLPERTEPWQEVEEFVMVKSNLLEKVSATDALAKLNNDRLDALRYTLGVSFFKGDKK